jgi:hypothetical protein
MAKPRRRREDEERLPPTPADQFLYLLFEMERLVARQLIKWTPTEATALHARLERIASALYPPSGKK